MVRVAVYAIALNEEKFVRRWAESAKDADYLLIADTGSTDRTVELAKELGVNVVTIGISPWRFDTARNASLACLPLDIDYCIALDMDEVLCEGWRESLERLAESGVTRPRYKYTWSWNEDGTPGLEYGGDKIHTRKGYVWKHPVHEVLSSDRMEEVQQWIPLEIHHYPDDSKSRGQYFPLLELSVREDPTDDRNAFYYARELFFNLRHAEAAAEFKRHLSLERAVWAPERAASYRYLAKCEPHNAAKWLVKAVEEAPGRREALVELAMHHYEHSQWEKCRAVILDALSIKSKPLDYLCEEFAWGYLPYDLAAISSYKLGLTDDAMSYGQEALRMNPTDKRLLDNLKYYEE